MPRLILSKFFSVEGRYIFARGLSAILAVSFALVYSRHLGVERRGLLTFVMIANSIFSILFISSLSIHLRNLKKNNQYNIFLGIYLIFLLLYGFVTPFLNLLVLEIYKYTYDSIIPRNLVYVLITYCFLSTLSFGFHDFLLLNNYVRVATVMTLMVLLIQIFTYLALTYLGTFSYFVSILLSMSISYLVMICVSLVITYKNQLLILRFSYSQMFKLFRGSETPFLFSIVTLFVERVDKIYIGLFASPSDLSRYSTSQTFFASPRFFSESIAKASLVRNRNLVTGKNLYSFLILALPFCFIAAYTVYSLTGKILGEEWIIPFYLLVGIALIELLRSLHSIVMTSVVQSQNYEQLKKLGLGQFAIGFLTQPLSIYFFGVQGAVVSGILLSIVGLILLRRFARE